MKNYIIALAILAMGLASCGSGSTESTANATDSTAVVAPDSAKVVDSTTMKALVQDTTVIK